MRDGAGRAAAFRVAGLALAVSGLLVLGVGWLLLPRLYPHVPLDGSAPVERFAGLDFQLTTGRGFARDGDELVAEALHRGRVAFHADARLNAGMYPVARLDLAGVHPDLRVALFWRSLPPTGEPHSIELTRGAAEVTWHVLAGEPEWRGMIADVAIGISGLQLFEPIRLRSLDFGPATRATLARLVWEDWRLLLPWHQGSVNDYRGTPAGAVVSPVAVVSVWLLLAMLLLAGYVRWHGLAVAAWMPAAIALVLVPWLALDGLWQLRLGEQVMATKVRYGGLDQVGKRAMEDDAWLQSQARAVLDVLGPLRGERLFILHDSVGHDYHRLRLQYHLLPLNVYNYGRFLPRPSNVRAGDYVLLLDEPMAVKFGPTAGALMDGRRRLPATLVLSQPNLLLFRLDEPVAKGMR